MTLRTVLLPAILVLGSPLLVLGSPFKSSTALVNQTALHHLQSPQVNGTWNASSSISNGTWPSQYGRVLPRQEESLDHSGGRSGEWPYSIDHQDALELNLQCHPPPDGNYKDSHYYPAMWSAQQFGVRGTLGKSSIDRPAFYEALVHAENAYHETTYNDEQGITTAQFLENIGSGGLVGDSDCYLISVGPIYESENPKCAPEGGKKGGDNNLWSPIGNWLSMDFVYATWEHCYNHGRGGSIDVNCLRYKMWTEW